MCRAVWILVETPETDEIVSSEQLDLLTRFFHLNILCGKRVDPKYLIVLHLVTRLPLESKTNVP